MSRTDEIRNTVINAIGIEELSFLVETSGSSHFEKDGKADSEMILTFIRQLNAIGFKFGVISYEDAAEKIAKSINDSNVSDRE